MTPEQFVSKWKAWQGHERQGYQEHFRDLCELLGQPAPHDPASYCFEKGVTKTSGSRGWADVWKRGHFAIEYKAKGANLEAALAQLQQYALALESPPLLVVCDFERWLIVTSFTNAVSERRLLAVDELRDPAALDVLRRLFTDPESFRPARTRQQVTEEVAREVGAIARDLRAKGHDPQKVAHLVIRLVFAMFAEAIGLLPDKLLTRTLESAVKSPDKAEKLLAGLFRAMRDGDAVFGPFDVPWFDGRLFDDDSVLPLSEPFLRRLLEAARRDWAELDPSIMGTLFERGLDPDKRGQLGKFYTDRDKILLIVEPVITRPIAAEWEEVKRRIAALVEEAERLRGRAAEAKRAEARALYHAHLQRLRRFRVLDPACGSGNFLNLALQALKDLEWRALIEAEELGLGQELRTSQVSPRQMLGIEINEYACELARASVWIADIQWLRRRGLGVERQPILEKLETIECRDALVDPDGGEAAWPEADVIIGNPPFLGVKKMYGALGKEYVDKIRGAYPDLSPSSDLVCFWFEKAFRQLNHDLAKRVGLVATNSIRGGRNRLVLDSISEHYTLYEAWSDEPWYQEGAALRVSIVCISKADDPVASSVHLDGSIVSRINPDLTASNAAVTKPRVLAENAGCAFNGIQKTGPFEIPGCKAREWLGAQGNPNLRPNSDVLRPYWNGVDLTRRPRDSWIIDFRDMDEKKASHYEKPFEYAKSVILPFRKQAATRHNSKATAFDMIARWWQFWRSRPEMRTAITHLGRYIVTMEVVKHRLFVWLASTVLPDKQLIVIGRDDDVTFGILHARFHEL